MGTRPRQGGEDDVKRIREAVKPTEKKATHIVPPKLRLIRGGALKVGPGPTATPRAVRKLLVDRARGRLAGGYYERTSVKQRLVDTLWEELFAEV